MSLVHVRAADGFISFPQDLHAPLDAVDMDRLNRNLPEEGRRGRQVLQVSEELLGLSQDLVPKSF